MSCIMRRIGRIGEDGCRLSLGTRYPLLDGLERRGNPVSRRERVGRSIRRLYGATPLRKEALADGRAQARVFRELLEHHDDVQRPA